MASRYASFTVLVVDDVASIRDYLAALLHDLGVGTVLTAGDGAEALALCKAALQPVNLVFCDLAMPGVDGVGTLRGLATHHPDVTVVPISGLEPALLAEVTQLARQLGLLVAGSMAKPFNEGVVRDMLELALRVRRGAPALAPEVLTLCADDIDRALEEDRVEVFYQPKIGLLDGRVRGVEALARILTVDGEIIGPAAFIEVAEQDAARIARLTARVIEQSIRQLGIWRNRGIALDLSINLSTQAIKGWDLPQTLSRLAALAGIENERITIEMAQAQLLQGPEAIAAIPRLRLHGFSLSIDDFGTADPGLKRLRGLPFNELKIDRSVVHGVADDRDARAVLQSSLRLGHRLHMRVVAQGVERLQDWRIVEHVGCDEAQGFLAAKPLPAVALTDFISAWERKLVLEPARFSP